MSSRSWGGQGRKSISVDGVLFADGTFVGPDGSDYLRRTQCQLNARHDEGVSVLHAIKSGLTDDKILEFLTRYKEQDSALTGSNEHDYYWHACGEQTDILLQAFNAFGRKGLRQMQLRWPANAT